MSQRKITCSAKWGQPGWKENDIGWHKSWRETVRNQDLMCQPNVLSFYQRNHRALRRLAYMKELEMLEQWLPQANEFQLYPAGKELMHCSTISYNSFHKAMPYKTLKNKGRNNFFGRCAVVSPGLCFSPRFCGGHSCFSKR